MKQKTQRTLSTPANLVNAEMLKDAIIDKFGSLSQFCRLTGRNRTQLKIRLQNSSPACREYQAAMLEDARITCAQPTAPGYHLTQINRDAIRAALGRYGTHRQFCSVCKPAKGGGAFTSVFISRVLCGSTSKITPRVKQLADELGVELAPAKHE